MAITLARETGQSMTFGGHRWTMYLTMAQYYGWNPKGTRKPKGYGIFKKWPGNYDTPDGQTVEPADAESLARTIAHALTDPHFDANADAMERQMRAEVSERVEPELMKTFQLAFDRATFEAFGRFCAQGGFQIQ